MRGTTIVTPEKLKKWLIIIGLAYLVFPRDLLPDYLGRGFGFVDDLLLIGFLRHFYVQRLRAFAAKAAAGEAGANPRQDRRERPQHAQTTAPEAASDPYTTLGITPSATQKAIQSAYRARMSEYHPDKVAHLGEDLQKLAHRKVLEIQQAYQKLRK
jgi:DnaJ like chaperone protein